MKKIDSLTFKKLITDAGIAFIGLSTKESINYMPYGCKIRDNVYSIAMRLLDEEGYEKVMLSDLVNPELLVNIDKISKVSKGYMKIENRNLMVAAGHEVNAYNYIKELLKYHYENTSLPIKIYNLGPVFRTNKNTKFPFNLGERKSFLECYSIFKTEQEAEKELEFAKKWNRKIIRDIFHIPSVESVRPISTNKKISKRTICIDSITPLDETIITGMTYFHNDVFTKALDLKYKDQTTNKNKPTYSVHFGLSENILFSYLLNSCDGENLRLYSFIAPIQVSILNAINSDEHDKIINELLSILDENNLRYEIEKISRKKITSRVKNNNMQGKPITLILKNHYDKIEITLQQNNDYELIDTIESNKIDGKKVIDKINKLLEENDNRITSDMNRREKETIIDCYDISMLDEIVKSGKIAKIYLKNTDESVHEIESYLTGGEVLGFGLEPQKGIDIITKEEIDTIAYVSRRS